MKTYDKLTNKEPAEALETVRCGFIAGAAGGFAEIAWVTLYAAATGANAGALARGVTTAVGVSALFPAAPVALGATVHMAIAVALGIALTFVWRMLSSHRSETINPFTFMAASLAAVWTINFFAVLPIVSPAFIHIVPYWVSLISKMMFGLTAAVTLQLLAVPASNVCRVRVAR